MPIAGARLIDHDVGYFLMRLAIGEGAKVAVHRSLDNKAREL